MIERYTRERMGKIWSDEFRFRKQLDVELAVCRAWGERGVIPKADLDIILAKADFDIDRINEIEKVTNHETVALIEAISEKVGPASRWIHMGLTSSDVLDTSFSLQIMEASDVILEGLRKLREITGKQALKYKDTLCIGRTHGVHAEPITFGLKILVWYEELGRDIERIERAKEIMRVGKISGAVGTWAFLNPELEVEALGYLGLKATSVTSQVIQRDRYAEFIASLAITMGTFDKIATEIRHLQRTEVAEAFEPFGKGQKGSSAMPHKRNPMTCERISGLARVVRGNLQVALENQALWHERDISHSSAERVIFPDSCIIVDYLTAKLSNIIENLDVRPERMMENLELTRGAIFSQRVLLALAESGMKREDAYPIVQSAAHTAIRDRTDFRDEIRKDKEVQARIGDKLDELFDYGYFVRWREEAFKRAGLG
ncbi:MAG: adenylosuccinate lyase [bacterium]|nr:adenylosuccinate lyase [bacterium]